MFINRQEPAFAAISTYPKPVDIELQASIAKHKEEFGFTDLDDPNAPPRKKVRLDLEHRPLAGARLKQARKKAQEKSNAARARLADGTAIHRQTDGGTKPAVKKSVKAKDSNHAS